MIRKFYNTIVGDPNVKALKRLEPIVAQVNELEPAFESKSDDELRHMTLEFRNRIQTAAALLTGELENAEQEYLAVLGTEEQKFARIEVDRIRREILQAEDEELAGNSARSVRRRARSQQAHHRSAPL